MNILFLSHTASGGDFVVGSHHLARALGTLGHTVIHLSTPVTPAHALLAKDLFVRERVSRWRQRGKKMQGFLDAVPCAALPWTLLNRFSRQPHKLFGALTRGSCQNILRAHRFSPELIVIDEPRLAGLLPLFPTARVVYRPTDLYAQMRKDGTILNAEKHLVGVVHHFVATSEPVADHLRALGAPSVLVLENGVDLSHFLRPEAEAAAPRPEGPIKAVYTGALDDRLCFESIALTADRNPSLELLLVGPFTPEMGERLRSRKNIRLTGAIPYAELPASLYQSALALLPLSKNPSNEGRSPMKLFEYAAAGLPVIATKTQELARRQLDFVALAESPEDFATQVQRWMNGALKLPDGRRTALAQDWKVKATRLLDYSMGTHES